MRRYAIYLLLLFPVLYASCKTFGGCKDDDLDISRRNYTGNELRMDGYYVSKPSYSYNGTATYNAELFFRNGTVYYTGVTGSLDSFEKELINKTRQVHDGKSSWGTFFISKDTLKASCWVAKLCGFPSVEWQGRIINDSTWVSGAANADTMYFRPLSSKPDSTNEYIPL